MPTAREIAERDQDDSYHAVPVRAVPLGPPSSDQIELIRAHVTDPSILETNEPFIWSAQASNDREDAYSTRMHRSTLENFAADATTGVAFMNSHRTGGLFSGGAELPLGRTFEGKVVGASANGPLRTEVSAFTLRGLNLTGLSTDQFIDGLRSGIARDVSVGFIGGEYRCSICDRDMRRDYECRHWPGMEYPKVDGKGKEVEGETVRAIAWIHGAHLSELSAVFDGATPGCMVTKAKRMAEAGEIRAETIDWLEQRYRIALPHPARSYPAASVPTAQKEAPVELTPEELATIRLALTETGAAPDAPVPTTVLGLVDELKTLRALPAEVERLKPFETEAGTLRGLADEGRKYRSDEVKRALAEGARAYGKDFAEETYRGLLEAAPLETVQKMATDWALVGDRQFPGGRVTQDADPTPIETGRKRRPAAAYS